MSKIKVSLPDQTESEIRRLVEQGEFINRDQAIEELLSMGISAYEVTEEEEESPVDESAFNQAAADQQDPALQDDVEGDDYTF
jgi:Arc/MetJ-type ribon-helix-helix transcriptional regulator